MKQVKFSHNLDDVQLEEVLEKALSNLKKGVENPDAPLPLPLAEILRKDSLNLFNKTTNNMLLEIDKVIKRGEKK
jgi:hypothetical protein